MRSYFPFYSWYVIITTVDGDMGIEVIFPFLFLVCYNYQGNIIGIACVIFPFLFLVCYNQLRQINKQLTVIFPFLFLVCYNPLRSSHKTQVSYFPFYSWYVII